MMTGNNLEVQTNLLQQTTHINWFRSEAVTEASLVSLHIVRIRSIRLIAILHLLIQQLIP